MKSCVSVRRQWKCCCSFLPPSKFTDPAGDPRLTTAVLEAELTPGLLNANRKLENSKDLTGNRSQNLPSGATVPQQTVRLASHETRRARKFKSRSDKNYSPTSLRLRAMKWRSQAKRLLALQYLKYDSSLLECGPLSLGEYYRRFEGHLCLHRRKHHDLSKRREIRTQLHSVTTQKVESSITYLWEPPIPHSRREVNIQEMQSIHSVVIIASEFMWT